MFEWNYIYGSILIKDYFKCIEVIESLELDNSFPYINTNMFSIGELEEPYYYDDRIVTFGATYKYFGYPKSPDWKIFILKMEHILRIIGFKCAQFHASGVNDDVTLYWHNIEDAGNDINENYKTSKYDFVKTKEWYFGYGKRNFHSPSLSSNNYSKLDLVYPIDYNKDIIREFINRI